MYMKMKSCDGQFASSKNKVDVDMGGAPIFKRNGMDDTFKNMVDDIISNGVSSEGTNVRPKWSDGTPAHTIKKFGVVNRYYLSEEFPILTLRKTFWKSALQEILWIWQKKSNVVSELGSKVWDQWVKPDGTIGKAYGYQLGKKHMIGGESIDQVDMILRELKNQPMSRRMVTNILVHADLDEMALHPCAYSCTFNYNHRTNKLNMILNQRSQDILVANAWNVAQYALLLMMIAQVSGMEAGELVHVIADAHIYDRHVDICKDLLKIPVGKACTMKMNPDVKNFYDFTVDDFTLEGYEPQTNVKNIPVAE